MSIRKPKDPHHSCVVADGNTVLTVVTGGRPYLHVEGINKDGVFLGSVGGDKTLRHLAHALLAATEATQADIDQAVEDERQAQQDDALRDPDTWRT